MILEKRICEFCGKEFEPKQPYQKFCCPNCCYKNKLKHDMQARQREKQAQQFIFGKRAFTGYKLWDINDPECREVALFLKTIKPLDFKAIAAEQERERQARLRESVGRIGGRHYPHGRKPR